MVDALDAVDTDNDRMVDILDWSFQEALNDVALDHLGTKRINKRSTPLVDQATRLLIEQCSKPWLGSRDTHHGVPVIAFLAHDSADTQISFVTATDSIRWHIL